MSAELTKELIVSILIIVFGSGIVLVATHPKISLFDNCRGCFAMLGLILIIGAVFIMPIGTEVYHNEITILKTDNVGDRWNVYFDDNDNIRSISCTDDAPWHTWNIGETVNMKYGRINTLYTTITQSTHYKLIEGENNG